MPSPAEILAGLTTIANQARGLAIAWHVVLAAVLVAVAVGWRPTQPRARALLSLPLLSVAVLALAFGNPFNGLVFMVAAVALAVLARRGATERARRGPGWMSAVGAASVAFGWCYPHFLEGSAALYLVAAPVGLVPCPTLATVIGLALLGGALGSRPWSLTLAGLGLFYGVFGALRLGVWLDVGLLLGAGALAVALFHREGGPALNRASAAG